MMNGDNIEKRLLQIEQKLDCILSQSEDRIGVNGPITQKRKRGRSGRIFFGLFLVVIGAIWLGQTLGITWLINLKVMPLALVILGIYLIFGIREV